MPAPANSFKAALAAKKPQIGLWLGLANAYTAEIAAGAGFDWLLIDGEHSPNDIRSMLAQLQAIGTRTHPIIRLPIGETWMVKQALDIGAQTILIPMVESAGQARELVRAMRYPPAGVRGVGAALARVSDFNRIRDYLHTADGEACLLVQVENRKGLGALDAILEVEGIDGVFIGPADLAADLGHIGQPGAPEVVNAIDDALGKIIKSGKAAGILTSDERQAKRYIEMGARFVAVGTDVGVLAGGLAALSGKFKGESDR